MINFLISVILFTVSVFLLGVSIRYGLKGAGRLDEYLSSKTSRAFTGFNWYYRLPFAIGFIPEYYFYLVIGRDNYFKVNWWPLKTSAFISVLPALAMLKSRSAVYHYFSLGLVKQHGLAALFTSGNFIWFLNIVLLLYLALFVLIVMESIKMHGIRSPFRIIIYGMLSLLMAELTIIVLGLIVFFTLVYFVWKIIKFLFFSRRKYRYRDEPDPDEETTSGILRKGLSSFKAEVKEWEQGVKQERKQKKETEKPKHKPKIRRRKPKVTRSSYDNDIPRLHPD